MALLLNEAQVRHLLDLPQLISTMERALLDFSQGKVRQPVRNVIDLPAPGSFLISMPAFLEGLPALGAKLVTGCPANAQRGLPTHLATLLLFDPETGALAAILEAGYLTEARTAAVSAVSAKLLARPESRTLALIGSGAQAESHLAALRLGFAFDEVRVWSPTAAHREEFARRHGVSEALSAREAVRGADIVVLATTSREPVIASEWIADGTHVISVGAPRPVQREMDPRLVARASLFVDSRAGAEVESGDFVMGVREGYFAADHIRAELGIVIGGGHPGRRSEDEVTIFKSLGLALEDVAAGWMVVGRSRF